MKEEHRERIQELIGGMQCPKDFECINSSPESLCKAKDIGLENYIECLGDNPRACKFTLRFGGGYFCRCPVRVYLNRKLNK